MSIYILNYLRLLLIIYIYCFIIKINFIQSNYKLLFDKLNLKTHKINNGINIPIYTTVETEREREREPERAR